MRFIPIVLLGFLSACGAAYFSPNVPTDDPLVEVIDLSFDTVTRANASQYTPKSLPAVFFQTAGGPLQGRTGAGALPEPPDLGPQTQPTSLPRRLPPNIPTMPYEIGVGDVIVLATPSAGNTVEQLTGLLAAQNSRQGYTVQDDGAIAIPGIGRVPLAGLTIEQAEAEIFQQLVGNQIDPTFSIEISEFNSQKVSVGGAVAKQQLIPITLTGLTLEQALTATGGLTVKDAQYASIRLYRDGQLYQIPVSEYLNTPAVQKTRLTSGDSLFVDTVYELDQAVQYFERQITLTRLRQAARTQALAELQAEVSIRRAALTERRTNFETRLAAGAVARDYAYLTGEVLKPSRFPLPFEHKASLADALFGESGIETKTANATQIYVLRAGGKGAQGPKTQAFKTQAWRLDISNAANLILATKMELRPNDIIFVAEQPITRWNRVIDQITPSLITSGVAAATN